MGDGEVLPVAQHQDGAVGRREAAQGGQQIQREGRGPGRRSRRLRQLADRSFGGAGAARRWERNVRNSTVRVYASGLSAAETVDQAAYTFAYVVWVRSSARWWSPHSSKAAR